MSSRLEGLVQDIQEVLGPRLGAVSVALGEVTVELRPDSYLESMQLLRDDARLAFDELIDLCGVDYLGFAGFEGEKRYATVVHLLSVQKNRRVRVRVFSEDNGFPVVDSLVSVWAAANWFERESFDLFGIVYSGHPDLRRILTDYGFVGHPFRKDFPISGHVEMRYDPEQQRVIYQSVTIEPRENTPRVVRESTYGEVGHG